jgi:hypothetical protein
VGKTEPKFTDLCPDIPDDDDDGFDWRLWAFIAAVVLLFVATATGGCSCNCHYSSMPT